MRQGAHRSRSGPHRVRRLLLGASVLALIAVPAGMAGASDKGSAPAGVTVYRAALSGDAEVPPIESDGKGSALFRMADGADSIRYRLQIGRLVGLTQAHIHYGAPDANGPVVAFIFGPSDPIDVARGQVSHGVLSGADLLGDFAGNFDAFVEALEAGLLYVNVHTVAVPSGELRGQIIPRDAKPPTDTTTTTGATTTTDASTTSTGATTTTSDATTTTTAPTTTTTAPTTTTTTAPTTTTTAPTTTTTTAPTTTTTAPTTTTTAPGGNVSASMFEFGFSPNPLTIDEGDTVTWTNDGQVIHTTTAGLPGAETGEWDSGVLNPGQSFSETFDTAGTFQYFCTIHPTTMQATVIVNG